MTETAIPDSARFEVKFVTRETELDRVLHWLHLHSAGFSRSYPNRRVNNVYFDTYNYSAVADKLAGTVSRAKVRYRWYGESVLPDAGVLEVKCRRNVLGWKLAYAVSELPHPADTWPAVRRALLDQLPPEGRNWLHAFPQSVMINRYRRRYYVSGDGRVRATVDTDIGVWDQRFKPRINVDRAADLPQTLVLELKFPPELRALAARILVDVPIRGSANSKYTIGVGSIGRR